MPRKIVLLGLVILAFNFCSRQALKDVKSVMEPVFSENVNRELNWIISMIRNVKMEGNEFALVQSYENLPNRCWIYDQALSLFVLTAFNKTAEVKKILNTLKYLQNKDGSFYFSYLISGLEPTSTKKYTGSIAWVAMALNFYKGITGDKSYNLMTWKILRWLEKQQVMDKSRGQYGGVSLGVRDDAFSTEHNLDAFSAFYYFGSKYYKKRAKLIKKFLKKNIYVKSEKPYFITGFNDRSLYLDCQSWSVLSFGKRYAKTLEFAKNNFLVFDGKLYGKSGIKGFFERRAKNAPVWSEGTEGMALAYYLTNQIHEGNFYHDQVKKMRGLNNGIAYATENNYEFSTSPSVAGTSWFLFYELKLNPFRPDRKNIKTIRRFQRKFGKK